MTPVTFRVAVSDDERRAIEAYVAPHSTLETAIRDALTTPGCGLAGVVVQDEFTHDVLVQWRERVLVYDAT